MSAMARFRRRKFGTVLRSLLLEIVRQTVRLPLSARNMNRIAAPDSKTTKNVERGGRVGATFMIYLRYFTRPLRIEAWSTFS